jgi:class 3 adenylate cyclase
MKSRNGESTIPRLLAGAGSPVGEASSRREEARESATGSLKIATERALLTIVFTDIVGSTELAERLGDHAWCTLLLQHHAVVRTEIARFDGRGIDTAGDGSRVSRVSAEGEILVSPTVKDLLAGSALRLSSRDLHALKGLSEPRLLFALEHDAAG